VRDFRAARPLLVAAWDAFDSAAMTALKRAGEPVSVEGCRHAVFQMRGPHMSLELPNGKLIWFAYAEAQMVTIKYETEDGDIRTMRRVGFTHMWVSNQNQWMRRSLHGGSLFQSYVQALCREILMEAQLRLMDEGWPIVMSVHDEVVCCVPDRPDWSMERFSCLFDKVPQWADGLPIGSEGWEGRRYRK
jgi:DNA polymerase